jgi:hypothetical protein
MTEITDEELDRAIDRLVREGRVVRITLPDGRPGIRLIKREKRDDQRTD